MTTTPPSSPAKPILASSLLAQEKSRFNDQQHHWETGLASLDKALPANLWTSCKVLGIIDDSDIVTTTDHRKDIQEGVPLVTQIIVTHLASLHDDDNKKTLSSNKSAASPLSPTTSAPAPALAAPAAYIIGPISSASTDNSPVSPTSLAKALDRLCLRPTLLDSVSLLQYFDFAGLADAVSEVSKTVFETDHRGRAKTHSILLLDGLVPTLSALARKSGPATTNALLALLLRSLTLLSRNRADLLVLISLEPAFFLDSLPGGGEEMSAFSSYASDKRRERDRRRRRRQPGERSGGGGGGGGASDDDAGLELEYRGAAGKVSTANSSNSWTAAVLAAGIDTLVLVHTVDGKDDVVEVPTDRVGDMTGRWGVR
jgi:hypothetical protein